MAKSEESTGQIGEEKEKSPFERASHRLICGQLGPLSCMGTGSLITARPWSRRKRWQRGARS